MRGVIIFGVRDELSRRHASTSNRWTNPVSGIDEAVRSQVRPGATP